MGKATRNRQTRRANENRERAALRETNQLLAGELLRIKRAERDAALAAAARPWWRRWRRQ